ncbi:glycerol-3-phosphate dehydrogenase/oxidase [Paucibacter sp. APW11]|uniref:Glycerol-3-phosphate dehydrogenase/oxidase n=1 Tax=Roseateles aquae TaxID=3077235 RepID=A0ABU3PH99_9BURK|nr:glycerol-3-phosphate dehydrogenase/oxidase [Paucibacter sp. APW11]MDT9001483.1 glycerol-3-phosphate dehydrogenase/oxidase [Paucibacter sp. APW11]
MKREQALDGLRAAGMAQPFDVLVIGGGIAGAGVALEAARAGARVALVEARDFASGTSSRSSKLVHGGLRYLAQGQFGLTRQSLRERNALLRDAAGLVAPLRFLLPVREGDKNGRALLGLGLLAYDVLARSRSRVWLGLEALLQRSPWLGRSGLRGGWSYLDAQTDDARLVLRALAEARSHGALTLNHLAVESLSRGEQGQVSGALLRDAISGERLAVAARCVINATGAWADGLRQQQGLSPRLRPLRGSHLLLPAWALPVSEAVAFAHPDDGRPVFALPWLGATLVGTTDLDHRESLDREPGISRAEFDYLLRALQHQFPSLDLGEQQVLSTWSGVRPVLASGQDLAPSEETREHFIAEEAGLITVTGGKLTTFRASALQALRLASRRVPALAMLTALDGPSTAPVFAAATLATRRRLLQDRRLGAALAQRWLDLYGEQALALQALVDERGAAELQPLGPPAPSRPVWGELRHACRSEAVEHLDDLLLRRSRLGLLMPEGAAELLPRLRLLCAEELHWSDSRWALEAQRYQDCIRRCYGVPPEDRT